MGDIKKQRKKYSPPVHPWEAERIKQEKDYIKEYGFKNKQEIWKVESKLKAFQDQAKKLTADTSQQGEKEKKQLLQKLSSFGLIQPDADLDEVLNLQVEDLMARRLQTLVLASGLAKTIKQARQFITHHHIKIGSRLITFPNYLVRVKDEESIQFSPRSSFNDPEHPEHLTSEQKEKKQEEKKTNQESADESKKQAHPSTKKTKPKNKKKESSKKEAGKTNKTNKKSDEAKK